MKKKESMWLIDSFIKVSYKYLLSIYCILETATVLI